MPDEDAGARDARIFLDNVEELATRRRPGDVLPGLDSIDGTDASGTIYCVVDLSGRLVHVGIDPGWWGVLGPGQVAAAILEAQRNAKFKAAMARLILTRYGHESAVWGGRRRAFADEREIPLPSPDDPTFETSMRAKLSRASSILGRAEQFARARDGAEHSVVSGPAGLFRLTIAGTEIQSAEIGARELGPADGDALAADALAALVSASRLTNPFTGTVGDQE